MKNRKVTTGFVAGALALTSVIGMGAAFGADGQNSGPQSGKAPTAEQIAEHEAQRQEKLEERLAKAVEDGKITEDQKDAILEFFEDNKPSIDPSASREENKAAKDAFKEKVEAFAEDNDIDLDVLKPAGRPGGPGAQNRKPPTAEEKAAQLEKRLSAAVSDGTITEDQKADILEFFEDNKPDVDEDATPQERKAANEAFKEKVEAFAQDNDIDLDVLKPAHGPGRPGGPGGHNGTGGHGGQNAQEGSQDS